MRTLLSFLVALLAVASPSLAQTFRAASSNSTYIAYRTDGRTGTGTFTDPYNGSTAARLDNILSNAPAGETIYFMPSQDYRTRPLLATNASAHIDSWWVKDNQKYIGVGGSGSVKIAMETNTVVPLGGTAVFKGRSFGNYTYPTNVLIQGVTVDNNYDGYVAGGHTVQGAVGAVAITGDNVELDDVVSRGMWGVDSQKECFPIYLTIYSGYTNRANYGRFVVRNSKVIIGVTNSSHDYISAITITPVVLGGGLNWVEPPPSAYALAQNNEIINYSPSAVTAFTVSPRTRYIGNYVKNLRLGYADTWRLHDFEFARNVTVGDNYPNLITIVLTTNNATQASIASNIKLRDNTLITRTNQGNGGGANAVIYLQSNSGLAYNWGDIPNVAASQTNWIGFSNVVISGNSFVSLDPSTTNNAGHYAIGGQIRSASISGNTFENFQVGVALAGRCEDVAIAGNTFSGGDRGVVQVTSANDNNQKSSRITVEGNRFLGQGRLSLSMFANDLIVSGNSFYDGNRYNTNVNTDTAFIFVSTNATGVVNPYLLSVSNVTIANNTFGYSTFPMQHDAQVYTVTNVQFYGNASGATVDPLDESTDSTVTGQHVYKSLYITNEGGLAAIYTNGVIHLGAGGGSESTTAGTNLVLVGTALSLSNAIISDVAKWRSNSTYTGGTLTAGQWVSWASNGAFFLTEASNPDAFVISADGTILTNGVALAGTGGSGGGFATGIDTTQLYTNASGTLGIKELALATNIVLEGAVITNDTATSIPLIVDTTSTNRLASWRVRGTEAVGIATNGAVELGNNMGLISVNTGSIGVRVSGTARMYLAGGNNATLYTATGGGIAAGTSLTPSDTHATAPYSFRADVIGSWSVKSNLLVHSTATVTNGFVNPIATLSASPVILNFGPTNMAQTLDVTGDITIGTTNRTASQYVERIVKLKVTSGGPHTITWAEANLHSLPAVTLLTNGTTLLISAGCWGTATNDVLIGTKYFQ